MAIFRFLSTAAGILLAGCLWTSCSHEEDPATASKLLTEYLKRPGSGEEFGTFLNSWEENASIETLRESLFDPKFTGPDEELEPGVHLARAWLFQHLDSPHLAAGSYREFIESGNAGSWLADQMRRHGSHVVGTLIDGAAEIYESQPPGDPDDTSLFPDNEFRDSLWKLVEAPACIWPIYEALSERDWAGKDFARPFLGRASACSMSKRPDQLFDFLRESPLYQPLGSFDAIDRSGRDERPTLLDEIIFHLGHCGQRNREALVSLLKRDRTESFGGDLLIAHLTGPIDEPVNTVDLFQGHLEELRKLPPERQRKLAGLASRMTLRLSGENIDPNGRYREFHQWLSDQGAASPGTALASSWLGAGRFEELPVEEHLMKTRLLELMHTLVARDPELAQETILHVARLDRDRLPPKEYANVQTTVVEEALKSFLFRARSPESRAFLLNTFEAGRGEICFVFGEALTEWISYDLITAFSEPDTPEERLAKLKKRCAIFAKHLRIEDPGILIVPLFDVVSKFPRGGVNHERLIDWAETEAAAEPEDAVSPVLLQLAAAARLRVRMRAKDRQPTAEDGEEAGILEAIVADTRDWQWRVAMAAQLLEANDGKMSDAFIVASAGVLAEGFDAGHRLISADEETIFRFAHRIKDPAARESACRSLYEGWNKRFNAGGKSTHRYQVLLIMCQLGVEFGEPEVTDKILKSWEPANRRPDAVVAAVNVGYLDLAERLMEENHTSYHYPASYFQRSPDFEVHAGKLLERLAKLGEGRPELAGLDLQARALFYNVPVMEKPGPVTAEAGGIATDLGNAYEESDTPPIPVKRALYLMARSGRPPGGMLPPLRKWFDQLEIGNFLETVHEPSLAAVESIKVLNNWRVSKGGGKDTGIARRVLEAFQSAGRIRLNSKNRNSLLDGLADRCIANFRHSISTGDKLTPEKIEEWTEIFRLFASIPTTVWDSKDRGREVGHLIGATALAGKSAELQPWWRSLGNDHRNALIMMGSERFNVFPIVDKLAAGSKPMKEDPEWRRRYLIDVLAAPQPRYNMDFVHHWQNDGIATAEEILDWEEDLLKIAPRSGNTALFLSRLSLNQGQADRALRLADKAIEDAGKIRLLRSRHQIEKARLLQKMDRPGDGAAFLSAALGSPDFHEDLEEAAEALIAELNGK